MAQIQRMSLEEIQNIKDFTIENCFGKITWPGDSDLSSLDLDSIITIKKNQIEVYPEDTYPTDDCKHVQGTKLNKPAKIIYKCMSQIGDNYLDSGAKLRKLLYKKKCRSLHLFA